MRRRELVGVLCLGGIGISSGCLSTVERSTNCSLSAQVGVAITNHRFSPHTVRVEIETPLLDREVFAKTFDVPAATDNDGSRYHPETVYEPAVVSNLRSYDVTIRYAEKTFTYSWQVTCETLYIEIRGDDEPSVSVVTRDLEPPTHQ